MATPTFIAYSGNVYSTADYSNSIAWLSSQQSAQFVDTQITVDKWFPDAPEIPGWKQCDPNEPFTENHGLLHYRSGGCLIDGLTESDLRGRDPSFNGVRPGFKWPVELHRLDGTHATYRRTGRSTIRRSKYSTPLPIP